MEVLPRQDWGQGSWLVTLGHSVFLAGLTHRRPLTSSRVCDAPRAGTQGRKALWPRGHAGCWLWGGQVSGPHPVGSVPPAGPNFVTPNSVSSWLREPLERAGIQHLGKCEPLPSP